MPSAKEKTMLEITTGIVEKLQAENRACLEALHKAQDKSKQQDHQLAEKDRIIKILEERLKSGNDGVLEMTNRQKELTIKHLEMQIHKLLNENEEMNTNLETIKANICTKCETKLLLQENVENKSVSKTYKPQSTVSKTLFQKKTYPSVCPKVGKSQERIIEHKDKRIMHLSKEVQRLSKVEKELTQKIYRLTKLLPMSRLPPETLTECLLQEIQFLESQNQSTGQHLNDDLFKTNAKSSGKSVLKDKLNLPNDKLNKSCLTNRKSFSHLHTKQGFNEEDATKTENEVLYKKLQKLYNDVNELKKIFLFESEKLSHGLNSTAKEYNQLKGQLEDIINNLNDVVQSILNRNMPIPTDSVINISSDSDDKYVITCLQERLKESLGLVTEYENEIKNLNEKLNHLQGELSDKERFGGKIHSTEGSGKIDTDSVEKLKEIIKLQDTQLELAESQLNSYQKFRKEFQRQNISNVDNVVKSNNISDLRYKELEKKLQVAEKNIKTYESVIEQLQNTVKRYEEDNERLEIELHKIKSKNISVQHISGSSDVSQISVLRKVNLELMEKVKSLETANSSLEADIKSYDNNSLAAAEQEKLLLKNQLEASEKQISSLQKCIETLQEKLKAKEKLLSKNQLEASEKQISSLQKSVETLQEKLKAKEKDMSELELQIKQVNSEKKLAEAFENDVTALKNELITKEKENRDLKESLHVLESTALEINIHRKSLHAKIKKLCNTIMANDDSESDSYQCKAIYKAAVLHSAQVLLNLDENFNLKEDGSDAENSALEEMKHQIEVYLTAVSRIHNLVTIKEQKKDELQKKYFDLNDICSQGLSVHFEEQPVEANLQSSSTLHNINNIETDVFSAASNNSSDELSSGKAETSAEQRMLLEERSASRSVATFFISNCTRLEELLEKEKYARIKFEKELEVRKGMIKDLKSQLKAEQSVIERLYTFIDQMRSEQCDKELMIEECNGVIKCLDEKNQKMSEQLSTTQLDLCHAKEKCSSLQRQIDSVQRLYLNEKYERARVLNEIKRSRTHNLQCQSNLSDT